MDALLALGGISAVCWFALYVVMAISREPKPIEPAARGDAPVLLAMGIAALLPLPIFASSALLASGGYLVVTSTAASRARRIAVIFLALTGALIWGRLLITMAPAPLLDFDATMAGALVGTKVTGNVVMNYGAPGSLIVMGGCSSLHNMSLAVVLYATLMSAFALRPTPRLIAAGGLAVVAMAAINAARLAAMVRFPAHFHFIHDGAGAEIFGLVSLLCAGLIIGAAIATTPDRRIAARVHDQRAF